MTENKEFDLLEFDGDWIVRANKIGMPREDVVELLNLLSRENEQLKKKVTTLEDTIDGLTGTMAHFMEDIV